MLGMELPTLLPRAIAWAERCAGEALRKGDSLAEAEISIATGVGVRHANRVRMLVVDHFPVADDLELRQAAMATGLLGADGLGLTLGYAVFIRNGYEEDKRLLRQEFRLVQQCEQRGSLAAFLAEYLTQIVQVGYQRAPFEQDARAHEADTG